MLGFPPQLINYYHILKNPILPLQSTQEKKMVKFKVKKQNAEGGMNSEQNSLKQKNYKITPSMPKSLLSEN